MTHQLVFIGGIHAVGKTSFCRKVAEHLNIGHVSASTLIREAKQSVIDEQKRVAQITENQDLLIQSLYNYIPPFQQFLLDGHFCLLDQDTSIQHVPIATFAAIAPKAVIVLKDVPEAIVERIKTRDNMNYDQGFIAHFQSCELDYAQNVCKTLSLPLLVHNLDASLDNVIEFTKTHLFE